MKSVITPQDEILTGIKEDLNQKASKKMELTDNIEKIQITRLHPNDIIIFKVKHVLDAKDLEFIKNAFPDNKILAIDVGCSIEIIRKE